MLSRLVYWLNVNMLKGGYTMCFLSDGILLASSGIQFYPLVRACTAIFSEFDLETWSKVFFLYFQMYLGLFPG